MNPGDPIWLTVRIGRHGDLSFPAQFVRTFGRRRVRIMVIELPRGGKFRDVDRLNIRPRVAASEGRP